MAYIVPDAVVELFSDISLDSGYENTLYFADTSSKDTYFTNLYATKGLGRFTDLSYNREQRGYVRIGMTRATAIQATYMRFKNTSFENKWFYAFVKNAEYINNGVTEITFELDTMMTWMGSFTLGQCFIERQHTLHDGIGNNICDEGIPVGDYITERTLNIEELDQPYPYKIAIVYANQNNTGSYYSKIYSGCKIEFCDTNIQADSFIDNMIANNLADNIVGIYMLPKQYADDAVIAHGDVIGHRVEIDKPYNDICGYVPKNNKLFCYPYKFLEVDNARGSSHNYCYEYFNGLPDTTSTGKCNFQFWISVSSNCETVCIPIYYKTYDPVNSESIFNWENRIGASHYPECSFSIDSYRAYRAQQNASLDYKLDKTEYLMGVGGKIMDTLTNISSEGNKKEASGFDKFVGELAGASLSALTSFSSARSGIREIFNTLVGNQVERREADHVKGEITPNVLWGVSALKMYAHQKSITKNYAMMIDDYFTMFGYAIKEIGVPNMNARPNFTYVKTVGCIAHGNMPSDHARKIEQIFDKGVRFWKSVDNIGNYNLNNAPV